MRTHFRRALWLIPGTVLTLALAPAALAAQPEVKAGAVSNTGGMVVYVAVDKGFFAKHGLNGKAIVRNTGPELSKAVDTGEVDYGAANVSNIPPALERGLEVKAVVGYVGSSYAKATDDNMLAIVVRPDSGIKSIADLKGKKIGTTFGSINDMYLVEIVRKNGLTESAINRVNASHPAMTALFDSGGIHAMAAWEPYVSNMLSKVKGSKSIVRGGDHVCFCAALHGKPKIVYKDRSVTQKFVDAMSEAAAYVRDPKNLDEIGRIGARYIRGMDADLIKSTHKYWVYDMRLGKNSHKAFNDAVKVLISQKKMKKPFDPAKYYDTSFIENTIKRHPEWFKDLPGES
jgi:ABC-type nitrate/sulfonate/bicarbonate transport system substrate-binding protein